MDPYLEQYWGDVHSSLVIYARDQLQGLLPQNLRARVEERVFVDAPQEGERNVYPDLRVFERSRRPAAPPPVTGVAVAQPLILHLEEEPVTETFIEIIDVGSGRSVVTVIEILSPANKRPGAGRDLYRKKQGELIEGKVSLVEIDLLRAGQWTVSVEQRHIPHSHRGMPYRLMVRRGWKPFKAELYAVNLRERLPTIQVPLRETDADVPLDLQAVLDRSYDNGGYQDDIDYEAELDPRLETDDAAWADALLREKGLRQRPAGGGPSRRTKRKKP
jgi:hypothetical protein